MPTAQQDHPLLDGNIMTIYRDGRHNYWTDEDNTKRPSVTTITSFVSKDTFAIGKAWAIKKIREHYEATGVLDWDFPDKVTASARTTGEELHSDIDQFIESGGKVIAENPAFNAWRRTMEENGRVFLASEQFVYHPVLKYGGTLDHIALDNRDRIIIQDVKSVDPETWKTYNSRNTKDKNWSQLSAYITALQAMNSKYQTAHAEVVYVCRDGSLVDIQEVDLDLGYELFEASLKLSNKHKELK